MGDRQHLIDLFGHDPTPGEVEPTRGLSRQLGGIATDLNMTITELFSIDITAWKGKAAQAFSDHVEHDVQPLILKAQKSFEGASHALGTWADRLEGFQNEAKALDREAVDVQNARQKADATAKVTSGTPAPTPSGTDHPGDSHDKAVAEANTAQSQLQKKYDDLVRRYKDEAKRLGDALEDAGHIAPAKPGLFHDILHGVEHAWDATTDWVKQHANLIKAIADVLSDISAVLQIAALICAPFEPIGAILEGLALATGGLALVGDLVAKAGGAKVSWTDIGIAAVGVLPGLGTFARGATDAAKGAEVADRAAQLSRAYETTVKAAEPEMGLAFGTTAEGISGGVKFKNVVLFGQKATQELTATSFKGRLALVAEDELASGGMVTSNFHMVLQNSIFRSVVGGVKDGKVLNFLDKTGTKVLNPDRLLGQSIDAGVNGVVTGTSIGGHIPEYRQQFGSRFQHMASAI